MREIAGKVHGHIRDFGFRTLRFGGAVEKEIKRAIGRQKRDAVAFQNAEIGAVT